VAYGDALDAGLAALGIDLAAESRSAVDDHVRLLVAWNDAINLTAVREPAAIAVRHVVDSLAGLDVLRARSIERFVDLGSGGGFPGLPLAAAAGARALLVDSIAKKARFLEASVEAVGLAGRVGVAARRAEDLARDREERGRWPAVTARAVASLADLVELALPLLAPGGVLLAWKSGYPTDALGLGGELSAAETALAAVGDGSITVGPAAADVAGTRAPAVASIADHRIVVVERGRRPIGDHWPRDPAARKRRPWS
jgi:16S rRNA (guanine527-N7)-methyltransferase